MRLGYFAMPMHPQGRDVGRDPARGPGGGHPRRPARLPRRLHRRAPHRPAREHHQQPAVPGHADPRHDADPAGHGHDQPLPHAPGAGRRATRAMFDHLSGGRFILGVSPGALPSDAELARASSTRTATRCSPRRSTSSPALWEQDPPYDIDLPGNRFKVTTATTFDDEVGRRDRAASRCRRPGRRSSAPWWRRSPRASSPWAPATSTRCRPTSCCRSGSPRTGRTTSRARSPPVPTASTADWRVARTVFVADDAGVAEAYGRDDANSPYRYYYGKMLAKMRTLGRLGLFKTSREQPDEEITLDCVLDELVIAGTPDSVAEQILALPRGDRRLRRARVRRPGLGRPRAGQALHGADGDQGHAAGQRRARARAGRTADVAADRLPPLSGGADDGGAAGRRRPRSAPGPRGALVGPFAPLLRSPELMTRLQKVGEYLRFESPLDRRLFEMTVLLVARHWDQQFEWAFHHPLALEAGLDPAVVDAIAEDRRPARGWTPRPRRSGTCSTSCTAPRASPTRPTPRPWPRWGRAAWSRWSATVGYYTTLAMVMNVARTPARRRAVPARRPRGRRGRRAVSLPGAGAAPHRGGRRRVLLLHPLGVDRSFWDGVVPRARRLRGADLRLPGARGDARARGAVHGRGPRRPGAAAAGRRGRRRGSTSSGVSLGGLVALRLAAERPGPGAAAGRGRRRGGLPEPMREMWRDRAARAPARGRGAVPRPDARAVVHRRPAGRGRPGRGAVPAAPSWPATPRLRAGLPGPGAGRRHRRPGPHHGADPRRLRRGRRAALHGGGAGVRRSGCRTPASCGCPRRGTPGSSSSRSSSATALRRLPRRGRAEVAR